MQRWAGALLHLRRNLNTGGATAPARILNSMAQLHGLKYQNSSARPPLPITMLACSIYRPASADVIAISKKIIL